MTTTIGIYFLGQYRPAYFEGANISIAMQKALNAVAATDDASWLSARIRNCAWELRKSNIESSSCEHGSRGVTAQKRPHDRWLDGVTAKLPNYPGLNYRFAANG